MSAPQNPWVDPEPPPFTPTPADPGENPPWSLLDVVQIAVLAIVSVLIFTIISAFVAQRFIYPKLSFVDVVKIPLVTIVAQLLDYILVLGFMVMTVKRAPERRFWRDVRWNWPKTWSTYLLIGVVLSIGLQGFAHLLPMPKELPIDRFFQTPQEAWILSIFGITLAPLMEELFFRGFLYPVLARWLGVGTAIVLTALGFGLLHAPQLGRAWGPVLVIFIVGLVLTIARAVTKSVAPGFLMHVAYNATISIFIFVATGGFRHLEKLNQ